MREILTVVVPLYLLIVVGLVAGRTRAFDGAAVPLNRYVYYFAIPAFLFSAIVEAPTGVGLGWAFFIIAAGLTVAVSALVYFGARATPWRDSRRQLSLTAGFGNIGYFGLPIVLGVLGPRAGLAVAVLVLIHNLIYLIGYPVLVSFTSGINVRAALVRSGPRNPMFGAVILGFVLYSAGWSLPQFLGSAVRLVADSTIPVALVAIGLALGPALRQLGRGSISWGQVLVIVVVKNFALPLLTWVACAVLMPDADRMLWAALVLMAAMPTGVASFTMAQEYDADPRPVAVTVATSTLVALATVPLFILAVA